MMRKSYKLLLVLYFVANTILLLYCYDLIQFKKQTLIDQSHEELISYFNDICLNSEYKLVAHVTKKWTTSMFIYIVADKKYDMQNETIKRTISNLNTLFSDGFHISITQDSLKANCILYLCSLQYLRKFKISHEEFRIIDKDIGGFFDFKYHLKSNNIYQASIFINTDMNLDKQKSAILEEITQSLGFANDSEIYKNSVFYQFKYIAGVTTFKFSILDEGVIKLLYNPQMKSSLNRLETIPVIKEILSKEDQVLAID